MRAQFIVLVSLLIIDLAAPPSGFAQDASPTPAAITLPAPTGLHAVGRTGIEWVDTTRIELLTDDP